MNKRNEQLQAMSFEQLHARSVEFHGHSCPGLIIGIKAAMYVMELPMQVAVLLYLVLDSSPTTHPSATPFASHRSAVFPTDAEKAFHSRSYR